jgi:glycosyltransferase involved in cell wall biosynthesis
VRICLFANPHALHTRRIATALAGRGLSVHIVHRDFFDIPGVTSECFAVPGPGLRYPFRRVARRDKYLTRFFREYDVVCVGFLNNWGFEPEVISEGSLAVWPWGSDICPPPGSPPISEHSLRRRLIMLRHAHAIAAFGSWFAQAIADYAGIGQGRVHIAPLGVDLNVFKPRPAPEGPPIVGFLKGFGRAYGPDHLVRAMPRIIASVPGVRFEMVGAGPLLDTCRALADSLKVSDHVRWTPPVPHQHVPDLIAGWRLSVIPSVRESFGLAALESSAMGVPVVASNVGGLPETVLDGRTGSLAAVGDSDAIAQAVIDLLCDHDKRRAMSEAGRRFVQTRFSWSECVSQFVTFLEAARSTAKTPASGPVVSAPEVALTP